MNSHLISNKNRFFDYNMFCDRTRLYMDETYGHHSTSDYSDKALMSPENLIIPAEYALIFSGDHYSYPISGSTENINFPCSVATEVASINPQTEKGKPEDEHGHGSSSIKAKIASHPSYPKLLNAYLDCQKVGAPPEIASLLDEIKREYEFCKQDELSVCLGLDPELDDFMETYYDILVKYKSDLSRPFDEAMSFLSKIETQLHNICKDVGRVCLALMGEPGYGGWSKNTWTPGVYAADDGVLPPDEEFIEVTEVHNKQIMSGNRELKDMLIFRYGSQINNIKQGFSKKKKGKLPNDAKTTLLQWWNAHYRWPYPTEADKITLAESTGLDQKQITNWFINQRKRHWKPSENMQFTVMDNISGEFFIDAD